MSRPARLPKRATDTLFLNDHIHVHVHWLFLRFWVPPLPSPPSHSGALSQCVVTGERRVDGLARGEVEDSGVVGGEEEVDEEESDGVFCRGSGSLERSSRVRREDVKRLMECAVMRSRYGSQCMSGSRRTGMVLTLLEGFWGVMEVRVGEASLPAKLRE
ncbi:hypothetical protein BDZ91DRAFT_795018 [Kalaharituber pfeilii]|nr:hypothetical protein BDZ91DRAFT_795018 [Kalaharituber pfeilii]